MGANAESFDAEVKIAVMDFQSGAGLVADGIVGPKTLKALNMPMDDAMMAKDKMMKETMADGKDAMMRDTSDKMAKDTMAADKMEKDAMLKDAMADGKDAMMKDGAITATLQRFDIGHDEKTMAITAVEGSYGTVTVTPLQGDS